MKLPFFLSKNPAQHLRLLTAGLGLVAIWLVLAFFCRTFFQQAIFRTDDMEIHAARLAQFYLSIKNGDIPPRWNVNTNFGFGMPTFEFTYLVPYALGTGFYILTKSIELSLNLVMVFALFWAVTGMYLLGWFKTRKAWPSWIAALLYLTLPYTMVNIFIRGALGEVTFMGIVPWIVLLVSATQYRKKWWYQLAWISCWTVALLTHHLLAMTLIPLMVGWYFWQKWPSLRQRHWAEVLPLELIIPTLMVICLSTFAWLPMLAEKQFVKLSNTDTLANVYKEVIPLQKLLASPWTDGGLGSFPSGLDRMRALGEGVWVILALASCSILYAVATRQRTSQKDAALLFWFGVAVMSIFLITPASTWLWQHLTLLKYLQFPWRFNWVVVLAACLLWLELQQKSSDKNWQLGLWLVTGIIVFYASVSLLFWAKPVATIATDDFHWFEYPETGMSLQELMPIDFVIQFNYRLAKQVIIRNIGNRTFEKNEQPLPFQDGSFDIHTWNGILMSYSVEATGAAEVMQKTAYFPGWQVTVNNQPVAIKTNDFEFPGRIVFPVPAGKSEVVARFTHNTWPRKWGERISAISALLTLGWVGFSVKKNFSKR